MIARRHPTALAFALAMICSTEAHAFDRIQPPEIATAQRAGLAGSLSGVAFGPADVSRGGFSLALPLASPGERGASLVSIAPSYNPDNGISPWGMGFSSSLAITRWRVAGSLAFDFDAGDELSSPFGRLTRGTDGAWYPVGLDNPVRVVASGADFVATMPDGSTQTFGGLTSSIATPRGTYAWYLRQARDARGRTTTLTWTKNASGQPFLASVTYGGTDGAQYQIALAYEAVSTTDAYGDLLPRFVDYKSGSAVGLDRRVTKVTMSAKSGGAYVERWHYALSYVEDVVGAAFYLARVDRTFASGEKAPPLVYDYALKGDGITASPMNEEPQLTQLFQQLSVAEDVVQPQRSAVADTNFDGNADLEVADDDRTTVLQRGSGTADDPLHYDLVKLPAPAAACTSDSALGCYDALCRPMKTQGADQLMPRLLAEIDPTNADLEVVDFEYSYPTDSTRIATCARDGTRLSVATVPTNWGKGDLTRMVDLDDDHRPDLVRIYSGGYDVVPSAGPNTWGAPISGALLDQYGGDTITPIALWISDVSGDGHPDLVAETQSALEVWHGIGGFHFVPNAQELLFKTRYGDYVPDLTQVSLVPADLNKDGLQDYFMTNSDPMAGRFVQYFTNVGSMFVETAIDALDALPATASSPVIGTFNASGNTGVTITDSGKGYTVQLDSPETGLMTSANDGAGTIVQFAYARGPATPGIRHRNALLARMDITSSGYDTASYDYAYASPVLHSIGRFLVGFDSVVEREGNLPAAPFAVHTRSFLNDDVASGLLSSSIDADLRMPGLLQIENRSYGAATFAGVPLRHLLQAENGWRSVDGSASLVDTTTYDGYDVPSCPSRVTTTTSRGTRVVTTTRAALPALPNALHCMASDVVTTATHADRSLDFREEEKIDRNAIGQPTKLSTLGAAGPLVGQTITYDADGDVQSIAVPGRGTSTFTYAPTTKLLVSTTAPDGMVVKVMARDALTDAVTDRRVTHGALAFDQLVRFDGQERLAAEWSNLDGASATDPTRSYTYAYATTNTPASILTRALVDSKSGAHSRIADLLSAKNEKLASGRDHGTSWVFDGFQARSRRTNTVDRFLIANQPSTTSPGTLDFATLLGGSPTKISETLGSTLGPAVSTTSELHADVEMRTGTSLAIDPSGAIVRTDTVNGGFATTTLLDPTMKVKLAYVDAAGTRWSYLYDASDRLRAVILPDGTRHSLTLDEYGRTTNVVRDGIASIARAYVATSDGGTTDLVATETTSSAPATGPGTPMLATRVSYDAIGRKVQEAHVDLVNGAAKSFAFFYDGATPASPSATGAQGFLTGVTGDGYEKVFAYRADGKVLHRAVTLDGWRTIATDLAYREDGSVKDRVVTVLDAAGKVVSTTAHHDDVDGLGRLSASALNGAPLATYTYDSFGRPQSTAFANGDAVGFSYDSFTREWIGTTTTRAAAAWSGPAVMQLKRNTRGFIGEELLGVGTSAVRRTYGYSSQGFLLTSTDGAP